MHWLLMGTLLGSIVARTHDSKEACEGRAVVLREKGVSAQCVQNPQPLTSNNVINGGGGWFCTQWSCTLQSAR